MMKRLIECLMHLWFENDRDTDSKIIDWQFKVIDYIVNQHLKVQPDTFDKSGWDTDYVSIQKIK